MSGCDPEAAAEALWRAVKGWGTDEDAVYREFAQLRTQGDWSAVQRAFRDAHPGECGGELKTAVADDLSESELARVKGIMAEAGVEWDDPLRYRAAAVPLDPSDSDEEPAEGDPGAGEGAERADAPAEAAPAEAAPAEAACSIQRAARQRGARRAASGRGAAQRALRESEEQQAAQQEADAAAAMLVAAAQGWATRAALCVQHRVHAAARAAARKQEELRRREAALTIQTKQRQRTAEARARRRRGIRDCVVYERRQRHWLGAAAGVDRLCISEARSRGAVGLSWWSRALAASVRTESALLQLRERNSRRRIAAAEATGTAWLFSAAATTLEAEPRGREDIDSDEHYERRGLAAEEAWARPLGLPQPAPSLLVEHHAARTRYAAATLAACVGALAGAAAFCRERSGAGQLPKRLLERWAWLLRRPWRPSGRQVDVPAAPPPLPGRRRQTPSPSRYDQNILRVTADWRDGCPPPPRPGTAEPAVPPPPPDSHLLELFGSRQRLPPPHTAGQDVARRRTRDEARRRRTEALERVARAEKRWQQRGMEWVLRESYAPSSLRRCRTPCVGSACGVRCRRGSKRGGLPGPALPRPHATLPPPRGRPPLAAVLPQPSPPAALATPAAASPSPHPPPEGPLPPAAPPDPPAASAEGSGSQGRSRGDDGAGRLVEAPPSASGTSRLRQRRGKAAAAVDAALHAGDTMLRGLPHRPGNVYAARALSEGRVSACEAKGRHRIAAREEQWRRSECSGFLADFAVLLAVVSTWRTLPGIRLPSTADFEWAEDTRRHNLATVFAGSLELLLSVGRSALARGEDPCTAAAAAAEGTAAAGSPPKRASQPQVTPH